MLGITNFWISRSVYSINSDVYVKIDPIHLFEYHYFDAYLLFWADFLLGIFQKLYFFDFVLFSYFPVFLCFSFVFRLKVVFYFSVGFAETCAPGVSESDSPQNKSAGYTNSRPNWRQGSLLYICAT